MSDMIIKHFDGKPVRFRTDNGKLTLTMKESGELLGHPHPKEAINHLYSSHKDEFDSDCTQVSVSDTPAEFNRPPQKERLFSLDGLILLSMFSEQPVAKKVRNWLRKIGREVAVQGFYGDPTFMRQLPITLNELIQQIVEIKTQLNTNLVAGPTDVRDLPTPTRRLKQELHTTLPYKFNSAAHFDNLYNEFHEKERGCSALQRMRGHLGHNPEFVVRRCPADDEFLRRALRAYIKTKWPPNKQQKLKLVLERKQTRRDAGNENL